jgi:fibronectin type 3 domain-containing protein
MTASFPQPGPPGPPGPSGGVTGLTTVDTGEAYKLIALSNGTVKAIPEAAVAPSAPTNLQRTVGLSAVTLTWDVATPTNYIVYRDNVVLASGVTETEYRDTTVTAGATYSYRVAAVDQYGQIGPSSGTVTAFIDPELNSAPLVTVLSWPEVAPVGSNTMVRVNAFDVDVQELALALQVDAGSVRPTEDPSIWILTI